MKNRTKTISLLVAVCMMLTLLPTVAFAAPMENITVTNITTKDDGFLAGFTLTYDVGKSSWGNDVNKATVRIGLQTQKFEGTFNEYGDYALAHDYTTWPDTPADCGFVAWGGQPFERAATGAKSQTANIAFDDSVNVGPGTYYVYAWTLWADAPYSKVYPDAYICEFTVGSDGTVTEDDFDVNSGTGTTPIITYTIQFNANGGTGTAPDNITVTAKKGDSASFTFPANSFTYEGHTFVGWSMKSTGDTVKQPGDTVNVTSEGDAIFTFYAQWTDNTTGGGNNNSGGAPGTVDPGTSSGISLWYNGGNSFGSSNSAVPTSVEIDGVPVSFNGNGREFTVGCISPNAKWVTVNWNSTSVTTNFTPDANATCAEISLPKTGDVSVMAFALMAVVAAAGAMGKK